MIIRVYRAQVHPGKEADFERLVQADAIPLMKRQPGLVTVHLGREWHGASEFVLVSIWQDLEALKGFAGENWQQPLVLHPEEKVLAKTWVEHFNEIGGTTL